MLSVNPASPATMCLIGCIAASQQVSRSLKSQSSSRVLVGNKGRRTSSEGSLPRGPVVTNEEETNPDDAATP